MRVQNSATAALINATPITLYTAPSDQNYEIDFAELENMGTAIASGNSVLIQEFSGATLVNTILAIGLPVQGIATTLTYIVQAGNKITLAQTGSATLSIRWAINGNLV